MTDGRRRRFAPLVDAEIWGLAPDHHTVDQQIRYFESYYNN